MKLTRRRFHSVAAAAASLAFARRTRAQDAQPNVLVFLTDDQAQGAMGAYGNPILKTPRMDQIAAEGMRFEQAFVTNALCAPSRASFLTGLYSHAHGVITNGDGPDFTKQPGMRPEQRTVVHALREGGYHTALVGKWHVRSDPSFFDSWVILPGQGEYRDPELIANGARIQARGHVEDVVGDQALAFLRHRKEDRPFFLMCNFKAPHRAWIPAERHANAFKDVVFPVPRTFDDDLAGRSEAVRKAELFLADMPDFASRGVDPKLPREERKKRNLQEMLRNYYRVLLGVDENVGRVLDELDRQKLTNDTLVVYSSDNGFFLGEHGFFDKRLMYEPSIRVPFLARHPGRIEAGRVDSEHAVLNVDLAATLLDWCGVRAPLATHGRSLAALLSGKATEWRRDFLYQFFEFPGVHSVKKHRGVREGRYKLMRFFEEPVELELYDLKDDPDEQKNLASDPSHGETLKRLLARLAELQAELGDDDANLARLIRNM